MEQGDITYAFEEGPGLILFYARSWSFHGRLLLHPSLLSTSSQLPRHVF